MRAVTIARLKKEGAAAYAHRLAVDPDHCPICCGDGTTTDARFGEKSLYLLDPGSRNERTVYRCVCRATPREFGERA